MLIALTGPAQIGKTTTARALRDVCGPTKIVSFADPLYAMLDACGVPRHSLKHEIHPAIGITPREWMQRTGDHIRAMCGDRWFVDRALYVARDFLSTRPRMVVIDDLRYDVEAAAVVSAGGFVVRLTGRDGHESRLGANADHSSERGVHPRYVHASIGIGGLAPADVARVILRTCDARATSRNGDPLTTSASV